MGVFSPVSGDQNKSPTKYMTKLFAIALVSATLWLNPIPNSGVEAELAPMSVPKQTPVLVANTGQKTLLTGVLKTICSCESTGHPDREPIQFNADGSVLLGVINPQDIGKCQINTHYWLTEAQRLGFDIFTDLGNEKMAIWIRDNDPRGIENWKWSKACWQK